MVLYIESLKKNVGLRPKWDRRDIALDRDLAVDLAVDLEQFQTNWTVWNGEQIKHTIQ